MKGFSGSISFVGKINFYVDADSEKEAMEKIFNQIDALHFNSNEVDIEGVEWDLVSEVGDKAIFDREKNQISFVENYKIKKQPE